MKIIRCLCVLVILVMLLFCFMLVRPSLPIEQTVNIMVDEKNLYQHVKILSIDLSPRSHLDVGNLNAAADYIKQQFKQYGHEVIEQVFRVDDVEYRNIILNLGPESGPKLIIGAHYDAAGAYPGADDNASGVAGLIELSRLLQENKPNKAITLVAYTLEEPPYYASAAMGSFVHAESEKQRNSDIELMISLETIAYFSEQENSQSFPVSLLKLFYPSKGNFIAVIDQLFSNQAHKVKVAMSAASSVPVYSMNAPKFIPGVDFSDHRNYWSHGYNAVMITDTAFYRNTQYHTAGDTIDRLDFQKMKEVVKGVYAFIEHRDKQ